MIEPLHIAAFVVAAALAAVALALAIARLRARGETAHAQAGTANAPRRQPPLAVVLAATTGVLAMSLGFYAFLSMRAAPLPNATDAGADASRAGLVRHLESRPDDGRAWVLLARLDFDADRFAEAAAEYDRALNASTKVAGDPGIWCEYADALGMAQGGSLAGRPRDVVMQVLARNPNYPKALEMAGSAAFEAREYSAAAQFWRQLLPQLANDAPAQRALATAIARAEQMTDGAVAQSGAPAAGK